MSELIKELVLKNDSKIVLLVMDGLGGLPRETGGKTELETARTPNLDALAAEAECGLHLPIGYGITPGSAPGHFALFGYEPTEYPIGRGVVAAMGVSFPLRAGDVAARVNFATRDDEGRITDRRAGRIPTEKGAELCEVLSAVRIPGVELFMRPVKDYRAVVVFRGQGLSDRVEDTDPQATGVRPREPSATSKKGERTAEVAGEFVRQAVELLRDHHPANALLMRGFAGLPSIPSMNELFGLSAVAMPVYPDYKGIARLLGMDVVEDLVSLEDQARALRDNWDRYDFFFVHHKYTDSRGEDGDFEAKVAEIEKVDAFLPSLTAMNPDVIVVTGDHSTPAVMKAHSSHPIPFLIRAERIRPDETREFGERACARGAWGVVPGKILIRLALSYAGRLAKFGA